MRRTIFLGLFVALLAFVPSTALAADPEKILRDCADDGILQGDYTAYQSRKYQNNQGIQPSLLFKDWEEGERGASAP